MRLTALVTACLVTVALAGPVPQGQRYIVRRPQNSISLHSEARQRNLNSGSPQQFIVTLDDDSREDAVLSLQGVGNFAATASQAPVAPSLRDQGSPQSFNLDGGAQFNVEFDDKNRESVELSLGSFSAGLECPAGQLRHGSRCVVPRINRNIFVFGKDDSPEQKSIDSVELPLPQLDYNIIFVRSRPDRKSKQLVVPPPQKKTVVYVLEDEITDKDLIEVPSYPDADPEVYYVKVRPGENPQLPGGLDLETAYSQAIRPSDSQETSFESSIELNIGAGSAFSGGDASFGGAAQGTASFDSDDAGFSSGGDFGVPLPAFSDTTADQRFDDGTSGFNVDGSDFSTGGDPGFDTDTTTDTDSTTFNGGNAGFSSVDAGFNGGNAGLNGGNAGFNGGNAGFNGGSAGFNGENAGFNGGNAGFNGGNAGFNSVNEGFNGGNAGLNGGNGGLNGGNGGLNGGNGGLNGGNGGLNGGNGGLNGGNGGLNGGNGRLNGGNAGFNGGNGGLNGGNAGFNGGNTGFNGGNAGFNGGNTGFNGGNTGFNGGNAGFNGGDAGFDAGFNGASVGVPLPTFRGDDTSDSRFSLDSGNTQTFSGNAQFTAESSFDNNQGLSTNIDFAAKGLSVEIDDGIVKIERSSKEVVQPAIRYQLPRAG